MSDDQIETLEPFIPDWVSAPGETIQDVIDERHLPLEDVQVGLGLSEEDLLKLLEGALIIDVPLARKLSSFLGSSSLFWLNRQRQYSEGVERLS